MKKRFLALFLALVMSLSMAPVIDVSAADTTTTEATTINFSEWAFNDLMIGDTYGIYPLAWYNKDMTAPITQGQLRILLAGLRRKLIETECVTKNSDPTYELSKKMTVEKVLNTYYSLLASYEFKSDIGLKNKDSIDFMKDNGIYTGANGELALSDTCTMEQACVITTRLVTYVFDKLDAASKGFLWVAKKGGNTVYMLGSIHFASTAVYPFSKEILDAYQSADSLVLEVNLFDTTGATKLAELGMYTDGTTLKDHVSDATYKKVIAIAGQYGISEAIITMFKPWYLYISFTSLAYTNTGDATKAAEASNLGIDMNFLTNAYTYGKPVMEIEGYEYQGKVLDSFSDELEEYLLTSTIDQLNGAISSGSNEYSQSMDLMLDLWHDGDVETFLEYNSVEDEYPELYASSTEKALMDEFQKKLFTQRDLGMADYIDKLLKAEGSSTYFVVVGSGHYVSDYSVLDMLKEKGYEITQIK